MKYFKRFFFCLLLVIGGWCDVQCQDLTKENPREDFGFYMYTNRDGKYAKLRSIKKNETGVYVIPAYVEKNGEKYPVKYTQEDMMKNKKYIRVLVFPKTMVEIAKNSLKDLPNLEKLVFNNEGRLRIGYAALCHCPKLKEIVVNGSGDISLDNFVFETPMPTYRSTVERAYCYSRTAGAWLGRLKGLKELTLGPEVKSAVWSALNTCSPEVVNLECENISSNNKSTNIFDKTSEPWFIKSKTSTFKFGPNVHYINYQAFAECNNIKVLDLSNTNIRIIGESAFMFCKNLEEVIFPNSLERIDSKAFFSCVSLKNIYIPDNVKSIGEDAFMGCNSLESISVKKGTSLATNAFTRLTQFGHVKVNLRDGNTVQAYSGDADIHGDRAKESFHRTMEIGMNVLSDAIDRAEANKGTGVSNTTSDEPSDGNSIVVPEINEVRKGDHGRLWDSNSNYVDTDYYDFKDGTTITVNHKYFEGAFTEKESWYPAHNKEFVEYKNAIDAARAGWVYKNYKLLRTIGRK